MVALKEVVARWKDGGSSAVASNCSFEHNADLSKCYDDRRTQVLTLRESNCVSNYTIDQIDPLKRFKVIEISPKDHFRKIWKMPECLGGYSRLWLLDILSIICIASLVNKVTIFAGMVA